MNEFVGFTTFIMFVFGNLFLLGLWVHNTFIANDESGNFYNDHLRSDYKYDPPRTLRLLLTLIFTTLISSVLFVGLNLVTLDILHEYQEVIHVETFKHLKILNEMSTTLLCLYLFRKIFIEIKSSHFVEDILNTLYSETSKEKRPTSNSGFKVNMSKYSEFLTKANKKK